MTCGQFITCMSKEMKHLSHADEMGAPFPIHPTLDISDWRAAQEWLR
jgi:hypothetical protein